MTKEKFKIYVSFQSDFKVLKNLSYKHNGAAIESWTTPLWGHFKFDIKNLSSF